MHIYSKLPHECSIDELNEFKAMVAEGGEVVAKGLLERIKRAESLIFVKDVKCVGVGAIKRPYNKYKNKVFEKAGVPGRAVDYSLELGWVYISPSARGKGISHKIMEVIINAVGESGCFTTTREDNHAMHHLFARYSFSMLGEKYASVNGDYSLVLYGYNP
jgi:predicted GNAT family N-acyltransferase